MPTRRVSRAAALLYVLTGSPALAQETPIGPPEPASTEQPGAPAEPEQPDPLPARAAQPAPAGSVSSPETLAATPATVSRPEPSSPATPPAPETKPAASVHLFARVNTVVQGANRAKLNDYRFDSILVVPGFKGQVRPWFSYTFNAVGYAESFDGATLRILDATAQFKPAEELQVWAGRLVVPFDRFNLSGPFRNLIWAFPGIYDGRPRIGGENSPFGRDSGAAVWGSIGGGTFKYYAMVHQLEHLERSPRFSGRVSLSLLDREAGYFVSSSYLGEKTTIALGAGVQYQSNGRLQPSMDATQPPAVLGDLWAATGDVFVEKVLGASGTFTLEAAYYHYDENRALDRGYYGVLAYLLPWQLGVGKAQVGFRAQRAHASERAPEEHDLSGIDASASYLMNGFNLRLAADYSRQWLGDGRTSNAILLGLQFGQP
jgi:hypothetical protein